MFADHSHSSNVNDSSPLHRSPQNSTEYVSYSADLSERQEALLERSESTTLFTPFEDGISSQRLLDSRGSYAFSFSPSLPSARDYQALQDVGRDSLTEGSPPSEPRLRNGSGVTSNMKSIWEKSTAFVKPRPPFKFVAKFSQGRDGWWKKQMLVDRSLRSMAVFTLLCAIIMGGIITSAYVKPFYYQFNNKYSNSIGGKDRKSCGSLEIGNVAVHLAINIAATMILGCSNTYQQLVTAPQVEEVPWLLSKNGEARVGTNSPWNINLKKSGKAKAWASWLLLICTSVPVHFLANSVIGPSFYIEMPTNITYLYNENFTMERSMFISLASFKTVLITYNRNCTAYKGTATAEEAQREFNLSSTVYQYTKGDCTLDESVFSLFGCLLIKAIYMIGLNYRARHRVKNHCLTYGDVIFASVIDPNLKIHNECLLNSGDGYRYNGASVS
ncbi:hypothetical protein DSL72_002424 [Monilinia vaccinii-corymbosi]|uniref:DUF6536 domain-containing protein n=1 Tax=Monilinia vaccinii-corymbosi TaxID=61207 RepID=A0A8A3PCL0_9HELO|nr:hypothetical protein DSL72_002424 [Monilinia vaccinii-corymbosi]